MARADIWLGWIIVVPLLFWTVSGLWMAARPIDEVRGVDLKAAPPALTLDQPLARSITLEGESYEVAGVMPAGFDFPEGTQLWVR